MATGASWVWMVAGVLVPVLLLIIGVLGVPRGSFVSIPLAQAAPLAGVFMAVGTAAVAAISRRVVPFFAASCGAVVTLGGWLWLRWVS